MQKERRNTPNSNNKGITIIALIITIIVMLILVGVTVNLALNGGLFDTAQKAKFQEELSMMNEEYQQHIVSKKLEQSNFELTGLYIYNETYKYQGNIVENSAGIKTAIPNIPEKHKKDVEVIKGELYYVSTNTKKLKWAEEIEIKVNPYATDEATGNILLSNESNLFLVDENGRLVIPETVKGKTITEIGEGAFARVEGLKEVVIPGTVKKIGANAFQECPNLEKVTIENGVETIGISAFQGCGNLKHVEMADSVKTLGQLAFYTCRSLENVILSNNIEEIRTHTFAVCSKLTKIVLPEKLIEIYNSAFASCINLETIKVGRDVQTIGPDAFRYCKKLTNIDIDPNNLNFTSKNGILFNKAETEMIYITSGAISGNTFIVPNTVTTLEGKVLGIYPQITKIEIPASVTTIDNYFFTSYINEITIDLNNPNYKILNGAVYSKDGTKLCYYFKNEAQVIVPEGTTSIESLAFSEGATNVEEIKIPDSLTTIGNQGIKSPKITEISLGENVTSISPLAFNGSGITNINISPNNPNYTFENGSLYNKDKTELIIASPKTKSITEFNIPNGVKKIGPYAFMNQIYMTKVTIPETVEEIGLSFQYCNSLKSITIPKNVKSIVRGCFSNSGLERIEINQAKDSIPGAPWGATIGDRAIIWKQ